MHLIILCEPYYCPIFSKCIVNYALCGQERMILNISAVTMILYIKQLVIDRKKYIYICMTLSIACNVKRNYKPFNLVTSINACLSPNIRYLV